ncbi:hypothetical protein C8F01DRAFT_1085447 [Mycena amicta]|nr:hypothetical protein C8F01DRAFT_1085447 [Mycena amicta]
MSAPLFMPLGSFVLPPPGNIPVQVHPSEVHAFVGPIPVDSCLALLYQQGGGKKLVRIRHKTLLAASNTDTGGIDYFDANPTACPDCARPFFPHNGAGFTILFQCPHWPDDADPVWANEEIDAIIPDPPPQAKRIQAPLGNVVVLKHEALGWEAPGVDATAATVFDVPLANVSPDDVPAIDGYVLRALSLLDAHRLGWRYFVQYEAAERLHLTSGGKQQGKAPTSAIPPSGQSTSFPRPASSAPCPSSAPAASFSIYPSSAPGPRFSIDHLGYDNDNDNVVLLLVLIVTGSPWHDEGSICVLVSTNVWPNVSLESPSPFPYPLAETDVKTHLQAQGSVCSAHAGRVGHRPAQEQIETVVQEEVGRLRGDSRLPEVPELTVSPRPAVQELILNFRFALQFGCESVADAQALVDFAAAKGWTSTKSTFGSRPVSLESVPRPCTDASDLVGRPPRKERDPWYICYVGVHPGVYSSYLECALNTLGVSGNVHDHRNTFEDAVDEFRCTTATSYELDRCCIRRAMSELDSVTKRTSPASPWHASTPLSHANGGTRHWPREHAAGPPRPESGRQQDAPDVSPSVREPFREAHRHSCRAIQQWSVKHPRCSPLPVSCGGPTLRGSGALPLLLGASGCGRHG